MGHILQAREAVVRALKPGVSMGQLYDTGEHVMKENGYRIEYNYLPDNKIGWGYTTFHGIGLGPMHDPPNVFAKDLVLAKNMTIAATCGVRFADSTLRFEDDYLITANGAELLSKLLPWQLTNEGTSIKS